MSNRVEEIRKRLLEMAEFVNWEGKGIYRPSEMLCWYIKLGLPKEMEQERQVILSELRLIAEDESFELDYTFFPSSNDVTT